MFMTVKEAAKKWNISDRRVRILCAEGKILSATREGRSWMFSTDAQKPADGRYKTSENLLAMIDRKKEELQKRRPYNSWGRERLS